MKILIYNLLISLFFISISQAAQGPSFEINDTDCDVASRALSKLLIDVKENKLSPALKAVYPGLLQKNIESYEGDPENCLTTTEDFIKVLSIDALAEFKQKKYKSIFLKGLRHESNQPGDIRQHSAVALAKIKAYDSYDDILQAVKDRTTFKLGYRESHPEIRTPTISDILNLEKRNLKNDVFSYPILGALIDLAESDDFDITEKAILRELKLKKSGRSNWTDIVRADMLRVAAKTGGKNAVKLIQKNSDLDAIYRLRAYAYIENNGIIEPVSSIIIDEARKDLADIPLNVKLAFNLLLKRKTKPSMLKIIQLSRHENSTVSFMAHVYLANTQSKESMEFIKTRIPGVSDRLKAEGFKVLAFNEQRNSVPIIKRLSQNAPLKLKVYGIWALAELGVIDPRMKAVDLINKITEQDENNAGINLRASLNETIEKIRKTRPAY